MGDLEGASTSGSRNRWTATVTILIHDQYEQPLEGAIVSGNWSDGASGGGSCTTDAFGICSVNKSNIKGNNQQVLFTVEVVSQDTFEYRPIDNHDDGGNGSTITVSKP